MGDCMQGILYIGSLGQLDLLKVTSFTCELEGLHGKSCI